jgi:hypothetical protein
MAKQKQCSAAICLDPWFAPVQDQIENASFAFDETSPATLIVHTTKFPDAQEKLLGKKTDQRGSAK